MLSLGGCMGISACHSDLPPVQLPREGIKAGDAGGLSRSCGPEAITQGPLGTVKNSGLRHLIPEEILLD